MCAFAQSKDPQQPDQCPRAHQFVAVAGRIELAGAHAVPHVATHVAIQACCVARSPGTVSMVSKNAAAWSMNALTLAGSSVRLL
jgi:hypothetical protein